MTTVLIAVDGSDLDRVVARRTLRLFGEDASYVVVNVNDEAVQLTSVPIAHGFASAMSAPELTRVADGLNASADDAEDVADDVADEAGLDHAVTVGEVGDPISVILSAADELGADVIALGTHDRSWVSRLFEPSVSQAISDRAHVPVLVVREAS